MITLKSHLEILKDVFLKDIFWFFLATSLALNLFFLYYFLLLQSTSLAVFLQSNTVFYTTTSIVLTIFISLLFGIAVSLFLYRWRKAKKFSVPDSSQSFLGSFFGAIATGCPACGAWLISILGIGGGLVAFPFQGLELKSLAILFLGWSIVTSNQAIYNQKRRICEPPKRRFWQVSPYLAGLAAISLIFFLPILAEKYDFKFSFQKSQAAAIFSPASEGERVFSIDLNSVLPESGFSLSVPYGDIGPKLLASGAIDLEKFKYVYERAGQPLTEKQLEILTQGSSEKITISGDNAYFLLNFLWALGLANKNPILEEGPLMRYGGLSRIGGFASTGGWTLAKSKATDYYSKYEIVPLTSRQQEELEDFAYNSYRPCCNNSTAFADCNHGMAALGLGEIMAARGARAEEMFEALKYFNAFWFPQQYLDLAKYFKAREGKDWPKVDPRLVMGENYSTASGWSRVRSWLSSNNLIEKAPSGGGGCGV